MGRKDMKKLSFKIKFMNNFRNSAQNLNGRALMLKINPSMKFLNRSREKLIYFLARKAKMRFTAACSLLNLNDDY